MNVCMYNFFLFTLKSFCTFKHGEIQNYFIIFLQAHIYLHTDGTLPHDLTFLVDELFGSNYYLSLTVPLFPLYLQYMQKQKAQYLSIFCNLCANIMCEVK